MIGGAALAASMILSSGVASVQAEAAPCELTGSEKALEGAMAERLVQTGDMEIFSSPQTTGAFGGCAVWSLRVNADGTVAQAEMVRGEPVGVHERLVGEWLRTTRFRPQPAPWTTVTVVRLTYDEEEAPQGE